MTEFTIKGLFELRSTNALARFNRLAAAVIAGLGVEWRRFFDNTLDRGHAEPQYFRVSPPLAERLEPRVVLSGGGIQTIASFVPPNGSNPGTIVVDSAGDVFGTTSSGGPQDQGIIFEVAHGSGTLTTLASFNFFPDGATLTLDSNGNLFGTAQRGGDQGDGGIFELARGSGSITFLASFSPFSESEPSGVTVDSSGNLFGTSGGGQPAVFELAHGSSEITVVATFGFGTDGASDLIVDSAGDLFGGADFEGSGTIFEIPHGSSSINTLATLPVFDSVEGLAVDSSGNLFGASGESNNTGGTVFEIPHGSSSLNTLASFNGTALAVDAKGDLLESTSGATSTTFLEIAHGQSSATTLATFSASSGTPDSEVLQSNGDVFGSTSANSGAAVGGTVFEIAHGSGSITTLGSFNASPGFSPSSIANDTNGDLFGATTSGGAGNDGTLFEVANGATSLTTIASFNGTNGSGPSNLIFDAAGDLFGTTSGDGANGDGTVFEIAKATSSIHTLASFNTTDGMAGGLALDTAGDLFGIASGDFTDNMGEVFEVVHATNTITTVATFNGNNGSEPNSIAVDDAGNVFGTTLSDSNNDGGDVFEIIHGSSSITVLASFNTFVTGAGPVGIVLDSNGDLFGTTETDSESNASGTDLISPHTVFEVARGSSTITTVASFNGSDGDTFYSLSFDSTGDLFGATSGPGGSFGTLFEIPQGSSSVVTLVTFNGTDGSAASAVLVESSGDLFGLTGDGGASGAGSVFSFAPGVPQQVQIISPPLTVASGAALGGPSGLQVAVEAAGGLVATDDSSTVTLTVSGGTFSNGQTTATAAAVNGIATFPNLSIVTAGAYTLMANDSGLTSSAPAALTVVSQGPTSVITAPDVTSPGAATSTITVDFVDPASAINVSSLQSSNLTVTGPDGTDLAVRFDGSSVGNGGNSVVATYTVDAPGGTWTTADLGSYLVSVNANSVFDASGTAAAATNQGFAVNFSEDGSFGPTAGNGAASGSLNLNSITAADVLQEQVPATASTAAGTFLLLVGQQTDPVTELSQGVLEQFQADGSTPNNVFGPNGNGIVTTPSGVADAFYGAAVQPNGQIVAVGSSNGAFLVARYNSNGSLDGTFGTGGFATADFGAGMATAYGVALEADGSIVVAGSANGVFAFARFTSTGQLDSNFNANGSTPGEVTLPSEGSGEVTDLAIEPGGDIVAVGSNGTYVVAVRLNPDGSLDDSFGSGGSTIVTQLAAAGTTSTAALAIQNGGGILVAGDAGSGYGVLRLTPGGSVDPAFGNGGESIANFNGTINLADSIALTPSGDQFVVVGITNPGGVAQVGAAAFNPDGTPDTNFGQAGQTLLPAPAMSGDGTMSLTSGPHTQAFHPQLSDFAFAAFQDDGKLLVGASNHAVTIIRRLSPVASDSVPVGGGAFGHIDHKNVRLAPFTIDGVMVAITLTGGSAMVSTQGNELVLSEVTGSPSITVKTTGGDVQLGDIAITGRLAALIAPTAILDGTLSVSSAIGQLRLQAINGVVVCAGSITSITVGSVSGSIAAGGALGTAKVGAVTGTIAASEIHSLTAASLTGATILAGTNLGSDGVLGGSGAAADTYHPGSIASLTIDGSVQGSFVGAGVNPVDGIFGDGDDVTAGAKSAINAVTIKGSLDAATQFESSGLAKKIHLQGKSVGTGTLLQFVKL